MKGITRARPIGPTREEAAIDELSERLGEGFALIEQARGGSWSARSQLLDLGMRACIYGARWKAVAELYGYSQRTLERWIARRNEIFAEYDRADKVPSHDGTESE